MCQCNKICNNQERCRSCILPEILPSDRRKSTQLQDSCRMAIDISNRHLNPWKTAIGEEHMYRWNGRTYGSGIRPIPQRQAQNGFLRNLHNDSREDVCKEGEAQMDNMMTKKRSSTCAVQATLLRSYCGVHTANHVQQVTWTSRDPRTFRCLRLKSPWILLSQHRSKVTSLCQCIRLSRTTMLHNWVMKVMHQTHFCVLSPW